MTASGETFVPLLVGPSPPVKHRVDGHQPASPQLHAAMDRAVSGRTHRYWRCVAFRPTGRPGTARRSTSGSSGGVTSCSTSWCASSTIAKGTGSAARYETRRQELVSALEQVYGALDREDIDPRDPGAPGPESLEPRRVMIDFDQVRLVDVSRHYGRRRAVSRITFSARRGDIVGLLGPNGAGKSTLIALLATLVTPSAGEIRYGDRDARSLGVAPAGADWASRARTASTPSSPKDRTWPSSPSCTGSTLAKLVDPALERAGLAHRADDDVSGFSRGMRQRLALERALLHRPRLVLLDEPFHGSRRSCRHRGGRTALTAGRRGNHHHSGHA